MSHMEQYLDRIIESNPAPGSAPEPGEALPPVPSAPAPQAQPAVEGAGHLLRGILRRWYVILIVFVLVAGLGVAAVLTLYEPGYVVTGYIHVAPAVENVLTGQAERDEVVNYDSFVRTQCLVLLSTPVLTQVAAELSERNLSYFKTNPKGILERLLQRFMTFETPTDPLDVLKKAVRVDAITATPVRGTTWIAVSMKSMVPEEAKVIVNTLMRDYITQYTLGTTQDEENTLTLLENQAKILRQKLERDRESIRALANEFGSTTLEARQDMMMQQTSEYISQLAKLEAERINLEIDIELLKQGLNEPVSLEDQVARKSAYIASDTRVNRLVDQIAAVERDVFMAERQLKPENPVLEEKKALLERLKQELAEKREEVGREFDEMVAHEAVQSKKDRLQAAEARLEQVLAHKAKLQELVDELDSRTRKVGRTNLDIQDLQMQEKWDQENYEKVLRRINEIELARKRRPRLSLQATAENRGIEDKRPQLCLASVFGGLGCGVFLAFLLTKADKRVRDPEQLSRRVPLPILGTVASSQSIRAARFAEQVAADYQTIRTNLGLLAPEGFPRKLAVVSATTREGKTTFSVNLATSLARSGKRVLLIDGDLRKPDVLGVLDMADAARRSHKVADGGFEYTIHTVPSRGIDVLVPDARRMNDVYELIASPMVAHRIDQMSQRYDHVIIDTPPVLAFPDAIIWGRIAGAAVLVSFAGRSLGPDLELTRFRLEQAKVRLLGVVMNNVQTEHAYHRYGQGYYGYENTKSSFFRRRKMLLPAEPEEDEDADRPAEQEAVTNS